LIYQAGAGLRPLLLDLIAAELDQYFTLIQPVAKAAAGRRTPRRCAQIDDGGQRDAAWNAPIALSLSEIICRDRNRIFPQ
jgi:hypothetical protein